MYARAKNSQRTHTVYWSGTITVHAKRSNSGNLYLRPLHDLHPVRLFRMQQPHQGFLALPLIKGVPFRRDESYGVGLPNPFAQDLIACRRDLNHLDKKVDVTDMHELSSKHSTRLP